MAFHVRPPKRAPHSPKTRAYIEATYRMLAEAAEAGEMAPTHAEVANAIGVRSEGSVGRWFATLKDEGRIRVHKPNSQFRVVEIVATGKKTSLIRTRPMHDGGRAARLRAAAPPMDPAPAALSLASAVMYLRAEGFLVTRSKIRPGCWLIGGIDGYDAQDVIAFAERMRSGKGRVAA